MPPVPSRAAALARYDILDSPAESEFDDIVRVASEACGMPVSLISLLDSDRQWFKARIGFGPTETALSSSICTQTIEQSDIFVIPDTTRDPRTAGNPLVTGAPHVRFYAGAPLETPEGAVLGALCVLDTKPNTLSASQAFILRTLARHVMTTLELRRSLKERRDEAEFMRSVLASSADCIKVLDLDARLTFMSEGGQRVMEVSDFNAIEGCPWPDFWQGSGNAEAKAAVASAKAGGTGHFQGAADTAAGNPRWWDVQVTPILDAAGRPERLLSVSRDITLQKTAERQITLSEARWRGLFTGMQEGFFVAELIRDGKGEATDYRFLEINPAFARQSGLPPDSIGRTIRSFVPEIAQGLIETFARVVETGEPELFEIQVPGLGRWFEVRANKDCGERFTCLFLDVTERKEAEARRAAMIELGDRLRDTTDAGRMAYDAAEIMGRTLNATRAGYGTTDPADETIVMETDWRAPGVASLTGLHHFRDYGSFIEDLKQGELVVVHDATTDPRTRSMAGALMAHGIRVLVNVPLIEQGQLVAVLYVHHDQPHVWTDADLAFVRDVADRTRAGIARVRAEEQQRVLNLELSHRMKNMLAMVQSIATQTMRTAPDMAAAKAVLSGRLIALGKSHDLLLGGAIGSTALKDIVDATLQPHRDRPDRFVGHGPEVKVGAKAALSLALILHELATNAAKYGALSTDHGQVTLAWDLHGDPADPTMRLQWTEAGGPPVVPPTRTGFGTRLIGRGLAGNFRGDADLAYPPTGVVCTIDAPLSGLQAEDTPAQR